MRRLRSIRLAGDEESLRRDRRINLISAPTTLPGNWNARCPDAGWAAAR